MKNLSQIQHLCCFSFSWSESTCFLNSHFCEKIGYISNTRLVFAFYEVFIVWWFDSTCRNQLLLQLVISFFFPISWTCSSCFLNHIYEKKLTNFTVVLILIFIDQVNIHVTFTILWKILVKIKQMWLNSICSLLV